MEGLRSRDLKRVLNSTEELDSIKNLDVFPQQLLGILRKLIQSDIYYSYTELSPNWKTITTLCDPFEASNLVRDHDSAFDAFAHEHPLVNHVKEGWINRVITLSDFFNRIRFHNTGLYTEYYKKTDVEFQISFSVPNLESYTAFAVNRKHRDFTERERLLLTLFRPHVTLTYRHLYDTARFLDKLALLQTGIEADGKGLILLSMNGAPCCTTDRARQWLKEYFQSPESWRKGLPIALSDWVHHQATTGRGEARTSFVVNRNGRRLHIHFLNGGNQGAILLLADENAEGISPNVLSKSLALTRRETEVLSWIPKGKTSREIGNILGLSFRTIEKHLEHIYVKLGVETRAAAMAHVFEMVPGRKK